MLLPQIAKTISNFWNSGEIITASFLAPRIAVFQALATLKKLGCWLTRKTNATSQASSSLFLGIDLVRHATLQNLVAIDFYFKHEDMGVKILKECVV